MIRDLKSLVTNILIISGLQVWIKMFWDILEITYDGGIQVSVSDSVIGFILSIALWWNIRKWISIKDKERGI